jgi:hypothetical protein
MPIQSEDVISMDDILLFYSQTDVKNKPMTMRTNLRLQLMRQQLADEEQKEQQIRQQIPQQQYRQQTNVIQMPVSVSPTEVPPQIYKVRPRESEISWLT